MEDPVNSSHDHQHDINKFKNEIMKHSIQEQIHQDKQMIWFHN